MMFRDRRDQRFRFGSLEGDYSPRRDHEHGTVKPTVLVKSSGSAKGESIWRR